MESNKPPVIPGERSLLAYVSSVMTPQLEGARQEVVHTFDRVPYLSRWAFEYTPGGSEPVDSTYLRHVREADIVVWLVGDTTTTPVENEVREALDSNRRLWVVILVDKGRDNRTEKLLQAVGLRAKWIEPARTGGLSQALEMTLNDEIVRALRGIPEMGRIARLEELGRSSRGRCIMRWQAAGVKRDLATNLADDLSVGAPPADAVPTLDRPLKVLTGEVGTGKSLIAERLLQTAIARYRDDAGAPVPVYLDAHEADGKLQRSILEHSDGLGNPHIQGVYAVIDGADEVGIGAALDLLNEARILVNTLPNSFIVLTCRPMPAIDHAEESVLIPRLSNEESETIVARVLGQSLSLGIYWHWPNSVKDAIRRPLFAILIGVYLLENDMRTPQSTAQLMDNLVQRVLGDFQMIPAFNLLCNLAVESINRDGGRVPSGEVADAMQLRELLGTRLIVEERGAIGFSLPILTQWFAAQAIGKRFVSVTDLLNTPGQIDQWRYPLIIAVGSFSHDAVMDILEPIALKDPAFTSEIVSQGIATWGLNEDVLPPPPLEAGERLRQAMRAWVTGIGPLARLVAPIDVEGSLLPLGVRVHNAWLSVAWYRGSDHLPNVNLLPTKIDSPELHNVWRTIRSARPGHQSAWVWRWTLEELVNNLHQILCNRSLPVEGGALMEEDVWYTALALMHRSTMNHDPMPVSELETRLKKYNGTQILNLNNIRRNLELLRAKIVTLQEAGCAKLDSPYPGPDIEYGGRWAWSQYSNERLLERIVAIITAALQGYEYIARNFFSTFVSRLWTAAILPAVFEGDFDPPRENDDGSVLGPGLNWRLRPLPMGSTTTIDIRMGDSRIRKSVQNWLEQADMFRSLRPAARSWIGPSVSGTTLFLFSEVPAREIAYDWLNNDLKRIAWSSGTIGRRY